MFQGCADVANPTAPFNFAPSPQRCANLQAKGLLASTTLPAQAAEAQGIINNFGILPEQNINQPVLWFSFVPQAIAVTYANAYGRLSVLDNLCNYSFAGTASSVPAQLAPNAEAQIFGTSNGIPPTAGVSLINNAVPGGKEDRASTPHHQPRRIAPMVTARIVAARYERRTAWAIAVQLQVPRSTSPPCWCARGSIGLRTSRRRHRSSATNGRIPGTWCISM